MWYYHASDGLTPSTEPKFDNIWYVWYHVFYKKLTNVSCVSTGVRDLRYGC